MTRSPLSSLTANSEMDWQFLIAVKARELEMLRELYADWQQFQGMRKLQIASPATTPQAAPAPVKKKPTQKKPKQAGKREAKRSLIEDYFGLHPGANDSEIAKATGAGRQLVAAVRLKMGIPALQRGGYPQGYVSPRQVKRQPKPPAWGQYKVSPHGTVEEFCSVSAE